MVFFLPIHLDMLLYNFSFSEPFPRMIISYRILFTIILVKRIFTKCCIKLGIDTTYAKHVSISRLKSSMSGNFWSETIA